jgi:hypothetical protein
MKGNHLATCAPLLKKLHIICTTSTRFTTADLVNNMSSFVGHVAHLTAAVPAAVLHRLPL